MRKSEMGRIRSIVRAGAISGISLMAVAAGDAAFAQAGQGAASAANVSTEPGIVVTATRRETGVQDTALAVAVTTGETLENYSVASFQDLTRIEPSVVVNNQGVAGNQFIIRGILSDIGSTTGFYIDEAPLVGGSGVEGNGDGRPGLRLHDINRVEVLKGPQGTLFGSGSMSGTIRVITNRPDPSGYEGGFSASVGLIEDGESLWEGDAFANVPLGDSVAIRAVAWGELGGEFIDHQITSLDGSSSFVDPNVNEREVWGGRLSMLFEASPELSILLTGIHQEVTVDDVQAWDLNTGPYVSTAPTVEGYEDEYSLLSATIEYEAPFGTFTAIGSYGRQEVLNPEDSTPTGLGLAGAFGLAPFKTLYATSQDFEDYTAELRFSSSFDGPVQIVVGGYYEYDDTAAQAVAVRANDQTGRVACLTLAECEAAGLRNPGFLSGGPFAGGVPASNFEYAVDTFRTVEQWAVYGQVDWEVMESLTASAGIRYYDASIHDRTIQVQDIVPDWVFGAITTPYETQDQRANENSPSYAFSLLYEISPDVSLFARAASGFRIGGTNNAANLANQAGVTIPDSYESDDLWSYEIGLKAYLLNRRLFLDTAVYQMDWTGQQLAAADPSGAFDYILNAGKTRIRGAELQLTYTSDIGLSFGGGVTYTDAVLTRDLDPEVLAAGTFGFAGDRVPRVPRWTVAGQARYETDVSDDVGVYAQTDFSYRSSSTYSFNDMNTFNPTLPDFFLLGAKVGMTTGPFDFSLFVRNLTDEVAIYGLDASPDGIRTYTPLPRTWGAQIRARF